MSTLGQVDPIPVSDPPIEGDRRPLSATWFRWLSQVLARSLLTWLRAASAVHRTGISAAIIGTSLFQPNQTGDFRISWYAEVTTPAGVSSALTVTISWKSNGVTRSVTFAPTELTTNLAAAAYGASLFIRADSGQSVSYATGYTSVGTPLIYLLDVQAEAAPL